MALLRRIRRQGEHHECDTLSPAVGVPPRRRHRPWIAPGQGYRSLRWRRVDRRPCRPESARLPLVNPAHFPCGWPRRTVRPIGARTRSLATGSNGCRSRPATSRTSVKRATVGNRMSGARSHRRHAYRHGPVPSAPLVGSPDVIGVRLQPLRYRPLRVFVATRPHDGGRPAGRYLLAADPIAIVAIGHHLSPGCLDRRSWWGYAVTVARSSSGSGGARGRWVDRGGRCGGVVHPSHHGRSSPGPRPRYRRAVVVAPDTTMAPVALSRAYPARRPRSVPDSPSLTG